MSTARQAAQKLSLFKEGWHKIPEVMFSAFVATLGLGVTGLCVVQYRKLGPNAAKHKLSYTVVRDTDVKDDPTLAKYN